MEICRLILQERSIKDGQTRQKLLLAHYNTCKDEIIKKGVEKEMLKAKKKENYEVMIENRNVLIADLQNKTKELLEDFVMTINELQDIQAMKIKEEEKDKMRNSIINNKRTKYVTKLIELSNTRQSNR